MVDDPRRPGPSEPPFRMTLYCTDGQARKFPIYADAAFDNIMSSMSWGPDRPFGGEILDALSERSILFGATVRLYSQLVEKGVGTFFFTDDNGHEWGIATRAVIAVEVEDPEAKERRAPSRLGFQPLELALPGQVRPPLRVIEGGAMSASGDDGRAET